MTIDEWLGADDPMTRLVMAKIHSGWLRQDGTSYDDDIDRKALDGTLTMQWLLAKEHDDGYDGGRVNALMGGTFEGGFYEFNNGTLILQDRQFRTIGRATPSMVIKIITKLAQEGRYLRRA